MDIQNPYFHSFQNRLDVIKHKKSMHCTDFTPITIEVKFLTRRAKTNPSDHFETRDAMLYHIAKNRIKENKELWEKGEISTATRYSAFEGSLGAKIQGIFFRVLCIAQAAWTNVCKKGSLKGCISKGLVNYDQKLLGKSLTTSWVDLSTAQMRDFVLKPDIRSLNSTDLAKTYSITHWHYNGPSDYSFTTEDGKVETLRNTVIANKDRSAKGISMMRRTDDYTTQESIAYTGRGDTLSKAVEQLNFIFQNELAKDPTVQKGLKKTNEGYELAVMVNNLMSSNVIRKMGILDLDVLDERDSIIREKEIFDALSQSPLTLKDKNGKEHTVTIKPLYFNQSFTSPLSMAEGSWRQTHMNREAYALLFLLIDDALEPHSSISEDDRQLLQSAKRHLSNPNTLKPVEEFFYRDLVAKILKIPMVDHCDDGLDRTSFALSTSSALQSWRNLQAMIPKDAPHSILTTPLFKNLFKANILGNQQAT